MSATYKADFNLWIEQTAQLLRSHRWHEIDVEHLIEEVESLGKSERLFIASQLTRLLLHLLKWQYQPQRRSDSWLDSITDSRTQIELTILDSPISVLPEECPYSLELVLDEDWLPEASNI